MDATSPLDTFLELSATLTGFSAFHLQGTGQAALYLDTVGKIAGEETLVALLAAYRGVLQAADDPAGLERGVRRAILAEPRLGAVARNLIKLWYTGIWYELPRDHTAVHGKSPLDRTFMVSPGSYVEGLVWPAIGANPAGAKPAGYGMWAFAPRTDSV